jgi:hypothetical protein
MKHRRDDPIWGKGSSSVSLYKDNRELLTCTTWAYLKGFVDWHYAIEKDELWVRLGDDYVQYSELERQL